MLSFIAAATGGDTSILWIGLGFIVLMFAMSIIPQRKRRKQMQDMMSNLSTGTRIKTIGGLIGKIMEIKEDGTMVINVGTEDFPSLIVIDKAAIYSNLDAQPANAASSVKSAPADVKEEHIVDDETKDNQ